jgi:hypothetical protein
LKQLCRHLSHSNLEKVINDLQANRGRSIVVCGDNNPDYQVIVNGINQLLGKYWGNHPF